MERAEQVRFVADENGWELHVTTEDGVTQRFNVHGLAWDLVDHTNDTIGDWRREGLRAAGLSSSAPDALTAEDLEAYPVGSPKWFGLQEALEFGMPEVE
jgi:hypothetical protein